MVYVAYDTISAEAIGGCGHPGRLLTDSILTMQPNELSSVAVTTLSADNKYWNTAKPFNLRNLGRPVPAKAYFEGAMLVDNEICTSTVCEDQYFPVVALPSIIKELEPAFSSCFPFIHDQNLVDDEDWKMYKSRVIGVWDPPITLKPTPVVKAPDLPSLFGEEQPRPASPGAGTPRLDQPQMTAVVAQPPSSQGMLNFDPEQAIRYRGQPVQPIAEGVESNHGDLQDPGSPLTLSKFIMDLSGPELQRLGAVVDFPLNGEAKEATFVGSINTRPSWRIDGYTLSLGGDPIKIDGHLLRLDAEGRLLSNHGSIPHLAKATSIDASSSALSGIDAVVSYKASGITSHLHSTSSRILVPYRGLIALLAVFMLCTG